MSEKEKETKAEREKDNMAEPISSHKKSQENEIDKLKKEREEYLNGWKRAKADFVNYKKDEYKRLEEIVKYSNEEIIHDLIDVLDSFELALNSLEANTQAEKGMYLIKSKLEDVLKRRGLKKIEVEVGQKFDPNFHEAVRVIEREDDDAGDEETIAEELETGYMLNDKVIRATKVKVYK